MTRRSNRSRTTGSGMARLTDPAGSCARYSGERSSRWARSSGQAMKAFVPGPLVVGHGVVAVSQVAVELESFVTADIGVMPFEGVAAGVRDEGGPPPQFYCWN